MKQELSYFERFVALNFSELRRFLVEGPISLFGNAMINRLSDQIKEKKKGEEKKSGGKIRPYSVNLEREQWKNNSCPEGERKTNLELYKSICVFFDLLKKDKGSDGSNTLMEIVLGYRYPDEPVTRGVTTSLQDNTFTKLFDYAGVDVSRLGISDNRKASFDQAKKLFLQSYLSDDFNRNSENLITFLQDVRNYSEHENLTPKDGFEQVKMWVYSYIYITYAIRRTLEQRENYKDISKDYWFTLFVPDGVLVFEENGKDKIEIISESESGKIYKYVKLLPFKQYKYQTQKDPNKQKFTLDPFSQYATLVPPENKTNFRIMYENSLLGLCKCGECNNDKLKKELLKGIKQIIDDQNTKWDDKFGVNNSSAVPSKDVKDSVEELNNLTKTLIPLINANNEELGKLKVQVDQITKIISSISLDDFKKEIADRIYSDPKAPEFINVFSEQLANLAKENKEEHKLTHEQLQSILDFISIVEEERKKGGEEERKKKRRKIICVCSMGVLAVAARLTVCMVLYLRFGDNIPQSLYDWAYKCGNKDAAYNNAVLLENEKKYPEAAEWYVKACERYANLLADNPNDSIRASRLAEMMMRGKGGIINKDTAEYYAHIAKRYDLEACLAVINGDHYKARDLINNYGGEKTVYLQLADASGMLFYPPSGKHQIDIDRCMSIIDSLANHDNPARMEALLMLAGIANEGIIAEDDNYLVYPSMYNAISYAQTADSLYNSLEAQLYLSRKFLILGSENDAKKYVLKANNNNRFDKGEQGFAPNRSNELMNHPQSCIYRAFNNSRNGYTDYRMTAYFYHKADSLIEKGHTYVKTKDFYKEWTDYIVNAKDLNSIEEILPLISHEFNDSTKIAIAEYIMAIKHFYGTGATKDYEKCKFYLSKSSAKGFCDAQLAYGIALDLDTVSDGINMIERLASNSDEDIHNDAVKYLLSKQIKTGNMDINLFKQLRDNDEYKMLVILNNIEDIDYLYHLDIDDLCWFRDNIEVCLSAANDCRSGLYAYLLGKLGEIYLILGRQDIAAFLLTMADNISVTSYTSFWNVSECFRKRGDTKSSTVYAAVFANCYFNNDGTVLYEPERSNVVGHIYNLYPEILDWVNKNTGHDFTQNVYFFVDLNLEKDGDIRKYESLVKNLRIELPDYVKPTFPITMKYFD